MQKYVYTCVTGCQAPLVPINTGPVGFNTVATQINVAPFQDQYVCGLRFTSQ